MLRIHTNNKKHTMCVPPFEAGGIKTETGLNRLLIVDDDEQVRRVASRLLRKTWQVEAVSNPYDAVSLLKERWFDAVLTDYEMPGENGLFVLKIAKRYQPHIRRVLFSGSGPSDLSAHLASGLVHCFVAKPPSREELIDSLKWDARPIRN